MYGRTLANILIRGNAIVRRLNVQHLNIFQIECQVIINTKFTNCGPIEESFDERNQLMIKVKISIHEYLLPPHKLKL